MDNLNTESLIDLSHTAAAPLLYECKYPWQALPLLCDFILKLGKMLDPEEYDNPSDGVWIAKSATVSPTAFIGSPCIIGLNTEVRHCAFIRGSVLVGDRAVIGNSTELKNCIISDCAQAPHYNYIGDSVLGFRSHLGAGAITSNVKSDKTEVSVGNTEARIHTGMRKLGAIVGDFAEIGCGCVLNPGSVVGKHTNVYPLTSVRGVLPPNSICKGAEAIVKKIKTD